MVIYSWRAPCRPFFQASDHGGGGAIPPEPDVPPAPGGDNTIVLPAVTSGTHVGPPAAASTPFSIPGILGIFSPAASPAPAGNLPDLPSPPRVIPNRRIWWLVLTDGMWVGALILMFLGVVFAFIGPMVTRESLIGLPFLLIGLGMLGGGVVMLYRRIREAVQDVQLQRTGEAARGQISDVRPNYRVAINGQHPWIIRYTYQVQGQTLEGKLSTMKFMGGGVQPGRAVWVLYRADEPAKSTLYPHP
jgi:hypothetical protein